MHRDAQALAGFEEGARSQVMQRLDGLFLALAQDAHADCHGIHAFQPLQPHGGIVVGAEIEGDALAALRGPARTDSRDDLHAGLPAQGLDQMTADEAAGAGDEHSHGDLLAPFRQA